MLKKTTGRRLRGKGFTLIELMIVVAIIGILASIALPAYREYVFASRRVDAKNALAELKMKQEKYRGNNATYADSLDDLDISANSPQGFYTIEIDADSVSATDYTATATVNASSAQSDDSAKCPSLVVTKAGFVAGEGSAASCWGL